MHVGLCRGTQHETKREPSRNPNVTQARSLAQLQQLTRFKTSQYRQRTIVSQQPIVKHQFPKGRIKQVRKRMSIEIDNEYPPPGHTTHLTKNRNHLLVNKVMREERTDDVIETIVRKRKF